MTSEQVPVCFHQRSRTFSCDWINLWPLKGTRQSDAEVPLGNVMEFVCWKNNFMGSQYTLSACLTSSPTWGFTACGAVLNLGSLTYCYVLALSLQIHDYCLLCRAQELVALRKPWKWWWKLTYTTVTSESLNPFSLSCFIFAISYFSLT